MKKVKKASIDNFKSLELTNQNDLKDMIKYNFFLVIIMVQFVANSQNYIKYNSIISSAIVNVLDSNYSDAIVKFDSAFVQFKPFPNDAYLAAQVSLLLENNLLTQKYLLIGAGVGLGITSINYPMFSKFKLREDFTSFEQEFSKVSGKYNNSLNSKYREDCINLVIRDQEANNTHSILNILRPYAKFTDKKLNKELDKILIDLDSLINKNQGILPFRSVIGVRSFEYDKTMPKNSEGTQYFLLATIFWHHPLIFQKWENELYKALETGEISARTYALIRTFCGQHFDNNSMSNEMKNQMKYQDYKYYVRWPEYVEKGDEDAVNIERKKIGLYPISYEYKMKKAQLDFNLQYKLIMKKNKIIENNSYKINYNYFNL